MPDLEKVIKGLEEVSDYFFDVYRNSTDSYKCEKAQEYSDAVIEAIALLKEQEPVKPRYEDFYGNIIARCGNCDAHIFNSYKYCPGCGRAVKWE